MKDIDKRDRRTFASMYGNRGSDNPNGHIHAYRIKGARNVFYFDNLQRQISELPKGTPDKVVTETVVKYYTDPSERRFEQTVSSGEVLVPGTKVFIHDVDIDTDFHAMKANMRGQVPVESINMLKDYVYDTKIHSPLSNYNPSLFKEIVSDIRNVVEGRVPENCSDFYRDFLSDMADKCFYKNQNGDILVRKECFFPNALSVQEKEINLEGSFNCLGLKQIPYCENKVVDSKIYELREIENSFLKVLREGKRSGDFSRITKDQMVSAFCGYGVLVEEDMVRKAQRDHIELKYFSNEYENVYNKVARRIILTECMKRSDEKYNLEVFSSSNAGFMTNPIPAMYFFHTDGVYFMNDVSGTSGVSNDENYIRNGILAFDMVGTRMKKDEFSADNYFKDIYRDKETVVRYLQTVRPDSGFDLNPEAAKKYEEEALRTIYFDNKDDFNKFRLRKTLYNLNVYGGISAKDRLINGIQEEIRANNSRFFGPYVSSYSFDFNKVINKVCSERHFNMPAFKKAINEIATEYRISFTLLPFDPNPGFRKKQPLVKDRSKENSIKNGTGSKKDTRRKSDDRDFDR